MIKEYPLFSLGNLVREMQKHNDFGLSFDDLTWMARAYIIDGREFWVNDRLGGFIFMMEYAGQQSIHGYKVIPGYAKAALRILRNMSKLYPRAYITLAQGNNRVFRLVKLAGFSRMQSYGYSGRTILKMENEYALTP